MRIRNNIYTIMKVYKYDEFVNEESKIRNAIVSLLFSLGLSQADAQYIDSIQKVDLLEVLSEYNENPTGIRHLKDLLKNNVNSPSEFIKYNLDINDDDTIILKPDRLPSIGLYINPNDAWLDHPHMGLNVNIPIRRK